MIKKIFLICICVIFGLTTICFADDEVEEFSEEEIAELFNENGEDETVLTSSGTSEEPETYSKHIICIERSTGQVLYEKDAYTKCAMASTTKIMTFLIAYENSDFSEEVEISSKAANTGGSTLGITAGSKMTMEALIYGLLLRSRK